jgi:3-hydroxy acid dehydrogenase/malonic semialdehyde reductase
MTNRRVALITGASSGIGEATARRLASEGYDLILVARREDRLNELCADLSKKIGSSSPDARFLPLVLDVTDREAVQKVFMKPQGELFNDLLSRLAVVVNNAGLAKGVDPMPEAKVEDWETMIATNVMGLLYVTRFTLAYIKANRGHVVNLGSVAGRWTYPGGGVYCATKAAVAAITEGLRLDLQGSGVRVTNIEPGKVSTEFSMVRFKDSERARKEYEGYEPLTPADIAECIAWSVMRPPHVNIQEMIIYPTAQASVTHLVRK